MNISKHNKRNPSNWCSSKNLSVQSYLVPTHRRMLLQLLLVFATQISRTRTAPDNCFGQFCLEEDYDKSRLPIHGYSPPPVSVEITPMLSEIFRVTDNDFSITFDATLKFNWIDNRIKFKNISDKVEGEFGDIPLAILNYIWVPPVQIQHMAEFVKNEGDPLFQQRLLNIVVKGNDIWLDMWVNTKPTITCKMRFNWYPFDDQICDFVIQAIPDSTKVQLSNTMNFSLNFQNAVLDYYVRLEKLPGESTQIDLGEGFDSWKDFYGADSTAELSWSRTGFQFMLKRRWSRYIFIYYIPSALCVFISWTSFLIDLDVLAGRSGLLVMLFLSLTTLLGSTITSSPRVAGTITALTAWILLHYAFLFTEIAAFAFLLARRRYSDLSEEEVKKFEKKADLIFLVFFISGYFVTVLVYWIAVIS